LRVAQEFIPGIKGIVRNGFVPEGRLNLLVPPGRKKSWPFLFPGMNSWAILIRPSRTKKILAFPLPRNEFLGYSHPSLQDEKNPGLSSSQE
jgi:hypothetical protein